MTKTVGTSEASKLMNISERDVRAICRQGLIKGAMQTRRNGPWQIPVESIEEWHEQNKKDKSKPKSKSRFWERNTIIATVTIISIIAGIAGFYADSGLRDWVLQKTGIDTTPPIEIIFPTAEPTPTASPADVAISQVLISESNSNYRIEVTTNNFTKNDVLATKIDLFFSETLEVMCTGVPPVTYEFGNTFNIETQQGDSLNFSGSVGLEENEYLYQVSGDSNSRCGFRRLHLEFDTSFVLVKDSYSSFNLVFPKEMTLKDGTEETTVSLVPYEYCRRPDFADANIKLVITTSQNEALNFEIDPDELCN